MSLNPPPTRLTQPFDMRIAPVSNGLDDDYYGSRARAIPQTETAPASFRAVEQADMVLPVVTTSSSSSTAWPTASPTHWKLPSTFCTRSGVKGNLGWRVLDPDHQPLVHREAGQLAKVSGQQCRLVITPAAEAASVQRHRHDDLSRYGLGTQKFSKQLAQLGGDSPNAAVLQAMDRSLDDPFHKER